MALCYLCDLNSIKRHAFNVGYQVAILTFLVKCITKEQYTNKTLPFLGGKGGYLISTLPQCDESLRNVALNPPPLPPYNMENVK